MEVVVPDGHLPVDELQQLVGRHYAAWAAGRDTAPATAMTLADCLIALKYNDSFWRELNELIAALRLAGEWDMMRAGLPDGVPGGVAGLTALVDVLPLDVESRATVIAGLRGAWQREEQVRTAFAQGRPEDIALELQQITENSEPRTLADRLWLRMQTATGAVSNNLLTKGAVIAGGVLLGLIILYLMMAIMPQTQSMAGTTLYKGVTPDPGST